MNIAPSKKKQEMRSDPLIDFLVEAKAWIQSNSNTIVASAIVVAFCLVIAVVYSSIRSSNERKAQEAFGNAMMSYVAKDRQKAIELFALVVDNYKRSPHATYSAYMIGTISKELGKFDDAIQWLSIAAKGNPRAGFVLGASTEALASAYEAQGKLGEALQTYEKALADKELTYRYPDIRWKAALITKELQQPDKAAAFCRQILADTLAMEYRQEAENLLAEIDAQKK